MSATALAVCLQTGATGRAAWIEDFSSPLGPMLIVRLDGPRYIFNPSPLLPSQWRYAYELPGWSLYRGNSRPFASSEVPR